MKGYEDIINLPHHISPTRQQMPMSDRADVYKRQILSLSGIIEKLSQVNTMSGAMKYLTVQSTEVC